MHAPSWFALGWGTRIVDSDHDGDLDIFVSNGHVYPGVDQSNLNTRYRQANQIFWNDGAGTFTERVLHPSDGLGLVASMVRRRIFRWWSNDWAQRSTQSWY